MRLMFLIIILCIYQTVHGQCDTIQSDLLRNHFITFKDKKYFRHSAFVLLDSCKNENRYYRDIKNGQITYFKTYWLSEKNVFEIENYFQNKEIKLTFDQKGTVNAKKLYNFYRQYNAYVNDTNSVIIKIIFFPLEFASKYTYAKHTAISVLVLSGDDQHTFYYCTIESNLEISNFKIVSFNKYGKQKGKSNAENY